MEFNPLNNENIDKKFIVEEATLCNLNKNNDNGQQNISTFDIEQFLTFAVNQKVSDIHLRVNTPPMVRKDGIMLRTKNPDLTQRDMEKIVDLIVPEKLIEKAKNSYDIDFSMEINGVSRFRVNMLHDFGNLGFVFRVIPYEVPPIDKLYLPPVLKSFPRLNNGLVLVTGPTGSGKSTTLAALLDHINQTQQKHVVTIEDPVEFVHSNKKCVFTQRQIGIDVKDFPDGVKYSLRQDPDIILIGEMRDKETISSALKAAETGHLVFSTLHTTDAVKTIYRIINAFEPHERDPVRLQLANALQGTIAQKLARKIEGKGRVPVTEVLVVTPAARDYIIKDEIDNLYELIKTGQHEGMMSMNLSLLRLVKNGLISEEEAIQTSDAPNEMKQMLGGAFHGTSGYDS